MRFLTIVLLLCLSAQSVVAAPFSSDTLHTVEQAETPGGLEELRKAVVATLVPAAGLETRTLTRLYVLASNGPVRQRLVREAKAWHTQLTIVSATDPSQIPQRLGATDALLVGEWRTGSTEAVPDLAALFPAGWPARAIGLFTPWAGKWVDATRAPWQQVAAADWQPHISHPWPVQDILDQLDTAAALATGRRAPEPYSVAAAQQVIREAVVSPLTVEFHNPPVLSRTKVGDPATDLVATIRPQRWQIGSDCLKIMIHRPHKGYGVSKSWYVSAMDHRKGASHQGGMVSLPKEEAQVMPALRRAMAHAAVVATMRRLADRPERIQGKLAVPVRGYGVLALEVGFTQLQQRIPLDEVWRLPGVRVAGETLQLNPDAPSRVQCQPDGLFMEDVGNPDVWIKITDQATIHPDDFFWFTPSGELGLYQAAHVSPEENQRVQVARAKAPNAGAGMEEGKTETMLAGKAITQVWEALQSGQIAQVDAGWPEAAFIRPNAVRQDVERGIVRNTNNLSQPVVLRWGLLDNGVREVKVRPAGTRFVEADTVLSRGDRVTRYGERFTIENVDAPASSDGRPQVMVRVTDKAGNALPTSSVAIDTRYANHCIVDWP